MSVVGQPAARITYKHLFMGVNIFVPFGEVCPAGACLGLLAACAWLMCTAARLNCHVWGMGRFVSSRTVTFTTTKLCRTSPTCWTGKQKSPSCPVGGDSPHAHFAVLIRLRSCRSLRYRMETLIISLSRRATRLSWKSPAAIGGGEGKCPAPQDSTDPDHCK